MDWKSVCSWTTFHSPPSRRHTCMMRAAAVSEVGRRRCLITPAPTLVAAERPRDSAAVRPGCSCILPSPASSPCPREMDVVGLAAVNIALVAEADLADLLPLMRGYCDFYTVAPSDEDLLALARSLIADPDCEGFQLIARESDGRALGFATVYWSWSTLAAARKGTM